MKENDGNLNLYDICGLTEEQRSAQNTFFSEVVDGFRSMANRFADNLSTIISLTVKDLKDAYDWVLDTVWCSVEGWFWRQTYTPLLKVEPIRVEPELWKCWYGLSEYGDGLYDFCRTHGEYLEKMEDMVSSVSEESEQVDEVSEQIDEARTKTWAIFKTTLRYMLAFVLTVIGLVVIHSFMEETSSK